MKLSEAIRQGVQLRREGRSGPFVRVANSDELLSDVYGAACEAIYPQVAKRNWNKDDKLSYDSDIAYFREVQEKYFSDYFQMPAVCPGAQKREFKHAGGRFSGRVIRGENEFIIEKEKTQILGGLTTACSLVINLAEFVEHVFYVHNWTRGECAEAVEWYEEQSAPLIVQNFVHYQDSSLLKQRGQRLTNTAIARYRERKSRWAAFWAG